MAILLEKMQKDVKALRDSYENLSWWKRLFYPRGLGPVLMKLENEEPYDLLHVYQTFFSNAWFFQRWIFSSLRLFSASRATPILKGAYREIGDLDELDNERWNTLNVAYFMKRTSGPSTIVEYIEESSGGYGKYYLDSVLNNIQEAGLLTEANLEKMMGDLEAFIHYFNALYRNESNNPISPLPDVPPSTVKTTKRIHAPDPVVKKNTQSLINATLTHPKKLVLAFTTLRKHNLLEGEQAQAIFDIVTSSENPWYAAHSFEGLKKCGLLESDYTPTIMQLMVTRANSRFASSFEKLQKQGLLKGEFEKKCIDALVNPREDLDFEQDPYDFALSLATLQENNLLQGSKAQANFEAVMKHRLPSSIRNAIDRLESNKLLTKTHAQANFDGIINHKYPKKVILALEILDKIDLLKGPLAQANFDALIPNNTDPFHIAYTLRIFHQAGLLTGTQTQTNFHNIITYQDLLIDDYLLDEMPPQKMTQEYLDELITICQQSELSADARRGQIVRSLLKASPEVLAFVEGRHDLYACQYVSPVIDSTLKDLHQRDEKRPPNTTFDLADEEESRLCFYIIRNLIRSNSQEALNEIGFLLRIPAVRALAVTAGTPGKNTNELLKLAVTLDNKQAASILLDIPEVHQFDKQDKSFTKADPEKSKSPEARGATPSKIGLFGQSSQEKSDSNDDLSPSHTSSVDLSQ